jgi:DNA polymerase III sliding clamp (beta) subunit (PCNA family)
MNTAIIDVKELKSALKFVGKCVSKESTAPILLHCLMSFDGKLQEVLLETTDCENRAGVYINAEESTKYLLTPMRIA